jgi:tetrapyrrole methylase family protein/MazG family protein
MDAPARVLRTKHHAASVPFVEAGIGTFDHYYESSESFDETYTHIVEDLVAQATQHGRVVYGVPGSPAILERTVTTLRNDTRVRVETVAGLSFLDLAWDRLSVDPVNAGVRLVNGETFRVDGANERGPLLVSHTWSNEILSQIKLAVECDGETSVVICHHLGLPDEQIIEVAWDELDRTIVADHLTCIYIPQLLHPPAYEIARAAEVVATLREACPWDAAQTHQSLVRHLLEESYEAIDAIEELGDPPDLAASELLEEELGDVLCQVLFHATIANEEGLFSLADVARSLADKLIRRHPHVYGDDGQRGRRDENAEAVLANWEQQKKIEKGRVSLTDGIPSALPALAYAAKIEKKAATVSFGLVDHLEETSLDAAIDALLLVDRQDYADALLAIARRAAVVGVDPEAALRQGARRLRDRFVRVEQRLALNRQDFADLDHEERLALWDEAKDELV